MNPCPCGLFFNDAKETTNGGRELCVAVGSDRNPCGMRLADHPHAPPGISTLPTPASSLSTFLLFFSSVKINISILIFYL